MQYNYLIHNYIRLINRYMLFGVIFILVCAYPLLSAAQQQETNEVHFYVLDKVEKTMAVNAEGKVDSYLPVATYSGKEFMGWSRETIDTPTNHKPPLVNLFNETFTEAETTLYAVFASPNGGKLTDEELTLTENFESYEAISDYSSSKIRTLENAQNGLKWAIYHGNVSDTKANVFSGTQGICLATKESNLAATGSIVVGKIKDLSSISWYAKLNKNLSTGMYVQCSTDSLNWKVLKHEGEDVQSSVAQQYNLKLADIDDLYIRIYGAYAENKLLLDDFTITTKVRKFYYTGYTTAPPSSEPAPAILTFDVNGGYEVESQKTGINEWVTLPKPKRGNVGFTGWKVSEMEGNTEVYQAGDEYLLNHDVTLEAQWDMAQRGTRMDIVDWNLNGVALNMGGKKIRNGVKCNDIQRSNGNYSGDNPQGDGTFAIDIDTLKQGQDVWLKVEWDYPESDCSGTPQAQSEGFYRVPYIYDNENAAISTSLTKADDIVVRSGHATVSSDLHVRHIYIYPSAELYIANGVTLTCDTLYIRTTPWKAGRLTNLGTLQAKSVFYTRICADKKAYFPFALPFTSHIADMRLSTGEALMYGTKWLLKYYNATSRAEQGTAHGSNWVKVEDDDIQACKGYILLSGAAWYREYCFPVEYHQHQETPTINVTAYTGTAAQTNWAHGGWNYICSPLTNTYTSQSASSPEEAMKISELQDDNCTYWQHVVTDILPAKPFYYQAANDGTLSFGDQLTVTPTKSLLQPHTLTSTPSTQWLVLELTNGTAADETNLYLHPTKFSTAYDARYDLEKMFGFGSRPQLYTIAKDGNLCFSALSDSVAKQHIALGFYCARDGEMLTLRLRPTAYMNRLEHVYLFDNQDNKRIDLLHSDYTFTAHAMENRDRFHLQCVFRYVTTTNLQTQSPPNTVSDKVLRNGQLYIIRQGQLFDALGRPVSEAKK